MVNVGLDLKTKSFPQRPECRQLVASVWRFSTIYRVGQFEFIYAYASLHYNLSSLQLRCSTILEFIYCRHFYRTSCSSPAGTPLMQVKLIVILPAKSIIVNRNQGWQVVKFYFNSVTKERTTDNGMTNFFVFRPIPNSKVLNLSVLCRQVYNIMYKLQVHINILYYWHPRQIV